MKHTPWKNILNYVLMPQIVPRLRQFWRDGFSFIAFSIARVFISSGLLKPQHPYGNSANIGHFGILHVMAQAGSNLKFSLKTADQTALFIVILVGLGLMAAQIGLLAFSLLTQTAFAAAPLPTTFAGFFETANPEQDIAFILMDRVFGIPDMFNSCVAQNLPCFPSVANPNPISEGAFPFPYHIGLQTMLSFYSYGLLILGAIILCYYVVSIVMETAQSGTAFGKRFNRVWAPIRLVVALGLLIPMSHGLNAAQYITLQVAKWGSSFATNGWALAVSTIEGTNTIYGTPNNLVGRPQNPTADDILLFMAVASTCKAAYERMYELRTGDSEDGANTDMGQDNVHNRVNIRGWLVRGGINNTESRMTLATASGMSWAEISEWSGYGDIIVAFGDYNPAAPEKYKGHLGKVMPTCGEMTLPVRRGRVPGAADTPYETMAYLYYSYFIYAPWEVTDNALNFHEMGVNIVNRTLPVGSDLSAPVTTPAEIQDRLDIYNGLVEPLVDSTYQQLQELTDMWTNDSAQYGWGGAAIWYNTIAEVNADFADAVMNIPYPSKYPYIMEWIAKEKAQNSVSVSGTDRYSPRLANGEAISLPNERDKEILKAMNKVYGDWSTYINSTYPASTGETFADTINALFQRLGLWSFSANETQHPMANLVVLGRSLVAKSIAAFGLSLASRAVQTLGNPLDIFAKAGKIFTTLAMIGLVAGVLLNYVVPFLPFIYFFFAVMTWIKTIFEAMVGVPLWALSHLRYDREGFPGPDSLTGYYMLIDIFVRPILIVFGLIMSSVVFFAMIRTLNNLFTLVVSNLSGFDHAAATSAAAGAMGSLDMMRGARDQFFFTLIYIVFVYMIGLSCFKMIDQVPASVLRWMGASADTFANSAAEDAGGQMTSAVKTGSINATQSAGSLSAIVSKGNSED